MDTPSLDHDEDADMSVNIDLSIESDYSPKYDPLNDVIIKNYSSSLTFMETEAMISAQRNNKGNNDNNDNKQVIGQTFAGIIESIPDKLSSDKKSFPFAIGDRVWGVSPSMFGQCWSDYVPIPYKAIAHAPMNIPLHYCGLYPLHFYQLNSMLKWAKLDNLQDLKEKSVLFIGTGRRSMVNTFAPFLKHIDENNAITIIDDDMHSRLNENVLKKCINIDNYHLLKCDQDGIYKNEDMMELINKYSSTFDIVIDSWAMDKSEIMEHCKLCKPNGKFFWRQNHMTQFNKNVGWRVALEGAKFLAEIHKAVERSYNVKFVPNVENKLDRGGLDQFSSYFSEMKFPIFIDKMYNLEDVQSALNYALGNDDSLLGENIGILIEKENDDDMDFFEDSCKPKIVKLPSIEQLYDEQNKDTKKTYNIDHNYDDDTISIDDIIESDHQSRINQSNEQFGFFQDKTEILESQTIAKNTKSPSNES